MEEKRILSIGYLRFEVPNEKPIADVLRAVEFLDGLIAVDWSGKSEPDKVDVNFKLELNTQRKATEGEGEPNG